MATPGDAIVTEAYKGLNKCESNGLCSPYTDKIGRQPWCGGYVEYVYRVAIGLNLTKYTKNPYSVATFWADMKRHGFALSANQSAPGDVIVFNWDGGAEDHMGIVVQNNHNGTYKTIEGNTGNCVRERSRNSKIVGVVRVPELGYTGVGGPSDPSTPAPPPDPVGMDYAMYVFDADDNHLYEGALQPVAHDAVIGWQTAPTLARGAGKKIQIWAGRGNYCLDAVSVLWDFSGTANAD